MNRGFVNLDHVPLTARVEDTDPRRFVQTVALGTRARVMAHVIVPTSLCMILDHTRDVLAHAMRKAQGDTVSPHARRVLERLDEHVFKRCTYCYEMLSLNHQKPRQLVLHVVGGVDTSDDDVWLYEVMYGLACWDCATAPWRSLVLVDELSYEPLAHSLARHAFGANLSLESLLLIHNNDVSRALAESYIWRLIDANKHTRDMVRAAADAEIMCAHCQKTHEDKARLRACDDCGAVAYCCTGVSDDKRLHVALTCYELSRIYHGVACQEFIKTNRLFHTDYARIVCSDDGDGDASAL